MTDLLSRLLFLFPKRIPREDLFTEAVARLFERNPRLCLDWLRDAGLISPGEESDGARVIVQTQKWLRPADANQQARRADLFIEVHHSTRAEDHRNSPEVVIIESKIGSREGHDQLKSHAEHLEGMTEFARRTLVYITRAYDPKDKNKILSTVGETIHFKQLRWQDFYHFLDEEVDGDALVEEVKAFMEEQGMARSNRFSTTDLATLSGMVRASEILIETLGGEVRARLQKLAGRRPRRESAGLQGIIDDGGYYLYAQLFETGAMECSLGFVLDEPDGFPKALIGVDADFGKEESEAAVAVMRRLLRRESWKAENLDGPAGTESWPEAWREKSLARVLPEDDHVGAVQRFFVESLDQVAKELTASKKERPDLPWNGE